MNKSFFLTLITSSICMSNALYPGHAISKQQYPFTALISITQMDGQEIRASGALIHEKMAITAASPFKHFQHGSVKVGITVTNNYYDDDRQHEFIQKVIRHQNYTYTLATLHYNIAIVVLKRKFQRFNTAHPLALPMSSGYASDSTELFVVGWGATSRDSIRALENEHLIYSTNTKGHALQVTTKDCEEVYEFNPDIDYSEYICAYSSNVNNNDGRSLCIGDEGAPLVEDKKNITSDYTLMGVAVYFMCGSYMPALYAKISGHLEWINDCIATNA